MATPLLVLGVGNVLMGDDGVGVHVVRALHDGAGLPPGTGVVDGGTAGLSLLPLIGDAASLVVVDAVDLDAEPGSVHLLTGPSLHADLMRLSVHQVGTSDLIAAARLIGTLPPDVVLVGVQPACLDPGTRLSPQVRSSLPEAIRAVRDRAHHLAGVIPPGG
jgi:hydrogenase maturation protease